MAGQMPAPGLEQDESEASNVTTLAAKGMWWVRPDLNWGQGAPSRTKLKQTADLVRRAQREARIGPSTTADSILERVALGLEGRLEADEITSMAMHGQPSAEPRPSVAELWSANDGWVRTPPVGSILPVQQKQRTALRPNLGRARPDVGHERPDLGQTVGRWC